MSKPDGYIGTLSVIWEDGDRNVFEIYKRNGRTLVGDHLVSVRNSKSLQGIILEISGIMSYPAKKVRQYNWLELITPLQFQK